LLTFKLEHLLTKDQILEIYMNQIFLGNRAYGFAAAAEVYFGKPLKDISIAEAAMLAGLPKAPSTYNPIATRKRARSRQLHIIERMEDNGFITAQQAQAPRSRRAALRPNAGNGHTCPRRIRGRNRAPDGVRAVRRRHLHPRPECLHHDQAPPTRKPPTKPLRGGIMDYERRQIYRGPEKFVDAARQPRWSARRRHGRCTCRATPTTAMWWPPWSLQPDAQKIPPCGADGESVEITGEGLRPAQSGLSDKAPPRSKSGPAP
jgi:penicillin-binding protein 1A